MKMVTVIQTSFEFIKRSGKVRLILSLQIKITLPLRFNTKPWTT